MLTPIWIAIVFVPLQGLVRCLNHDNRGAAFVGRRLAKEEKVSVLLSRLPTFRVVHLGEGGFHAAYAAADFFGVADGGRGQP
jgi:hypothetical protein